MPTKIFLKPNPDRLVEGKPVKVYDPAHADFLPADGRAVILNTYWVNRIRNGEVLRAASAPVAPAPNNADVIAALKSKKDVIAFAAEKISAEFAETLNTDAKLAELKDAVLAELNK